MTTETLITDRTLMPDWSSRYELVEPRGTGGFGQVVRANDSWLDRTIAVKILDPLLALSDPEVRRFQQEARILAKLSHPNIPSIYDVVFMTAENSPDGHPYFHILFEYIDGVTLYDHLQTDGPATLAHAVRWFVQLASALEHAHSLGVIHRDIKPKNIIIREGMQSCCLVDFGIAITADEAERLTRIGYAIGTPGYMSPEQAAGEDVDQRTDVFNLGVCLYETLAGTQIDLGAYRQLSSINEIIPPSIDELIQQCLERKDRRLPDAGAFAKDLINASQPRVALSSILAEGTLGELGSALENMTSADFAQRPAGQRALIISTILDLAESTESRLEFPLVELVANS